jgi:hypothetical protein
MKNFLFTAGATLALMTLASCSNDETSTNGVTNPDMINYQVVTSNSTRANSMFKSGSHPDFKVLATLVDETNANANKIYFGFDLVNYTDGAYVPVNSRYWPAGALDFFAYSPNIVANGNNGVPAYTGIGDNQKLLFSDIAISEYANACEVDGKKYDGQEDFLYAVTRGAKKDDGQVKFNFRHALAQLAFQFKNESNGIHVEVQGVKLVNINNNGNLEIAATSTTKQFVENASETQTVSGNYQTPSCKWYADGTKAPMAGTDATVTGRHPFSAIEKAAPMEVAFSKTEVTPFVVNDAAGVADVMYVMPQALNPIDFTGVTTGAVKPVYKYTGMYFLIKCKIYNIADVEGGFNASSDVLLYGNENGTCKDILIPVAAFKDNESEWKAGKKYIYTFIFGRHGGNGGYDPENPNPEDPVLDEVTYSVESVTVDDWYYYGNTDVDMTTKK